MPERSAMKITTALLHGARTRHNTIGFSARDCDGGAKGLALRRPGGRPAVASRNGIPTAEDRATELFMTKSVATIRNRQSVNSMRPLRSAQP